MQLSIEEKKLYRFLTATAKKKPHNINAVHGNITLSNALSLQEKGLCKVVQDRDRVFIYPIGNVSFLSNKSKRIIGSVVRNTIDSWSYLIWTENFMPKSDEIKKHIENQLNKSIDCRLECIEENNFQNFKIILHFENDTCIGLLNFTGHKSAFWTRVDVQWL